MAKFHGKRYYLGAWNYVLLDILYMIPVIGLIVLLIHAVGDKNDNRRYYARSYFARLLVFVGILVIAAGLYYVIAGQQAFLDLFNGQSAFWQNIRIKLLRSLYSQNWPFRA